MNNSGTLISVRGLTKVIAKRRIVDAVDFDLAPGEVFGLLGPNGAGKSTTIKLLIGLMRITEGTVYYKGSDLKQQTIAAKEKIGCIVENPDLYTHLTGRENLKLFASMYDGITEARQLECARITKIDQALDKKVKAYSLGMKQRLGIAVALLNNPEILILDEPTNGLDPAGIHDTRILLRQLAHEQGLAVMVSSHILSEMQLLCDRVGIMDQGRVITIQTVQDLMRATGAGQGRYEIEIHPMDEALNTLRDLGHTVIPQGQRILVTVRDSEYTANQLLSDMIQAGYEVLSFNPAGGQSLEEAFIALTEGGIIQ